jgi:hypothetical protein
MKKDTMTRMRMRKRLEVCGKYGWFKGNQYRRWNHMGMDTK